MINLSLEDSSDSSMKSKSSKLLVGLLMMRLPRRPGKDSVVSAWFGLKIITTRDASHDGLIMVGIF